jgi:hypothetical protein
VKPILVLLGVALIIAAWRPAVAADAATNPVRRSFWKGLFGTKPSTNNAALSGSSAGSTRPVSISELSSEQVARGLKEALGRGLDQAVAQLGREGGFLTNMNVRIPMPERLQTVEKLLRRAGQDQLADEFITNMNRAAEKAVPVAASVFSESLKQMTVTDAHAILKGSTNAATEYFRRTTGPELHEKFRPIVAEWTGKAGATAAYKNLLDRASFATAFLNRDALDLDDYVTAKATDGLFKMVAEEERRIRENPVARTTDLLKTVFGALGK